MEFLTEFSEVWSQVQARHAMLVHVPIVLSLLCVVAAVWSAVRLGKIAVLHRAALVLTLILAVTANVTARSGHEAEEAVEGILSEEGEHALHEHESLGDKIWFLAAAASVCLAVGFAKKDWVRTASSWAAAVLTVVAAGVAANAGHFGGQLVYKYGAVIPTHAYSTVRTGDPDSPDPRVVHFQQHIVPILANICWRCHNPDKADRSANLDQTYIAGLLKGGDSGPALIPGKPEESLLIEAISWENPDLQMPPKTQLPTDQIAAFKQWITDGAVWELPEPESSEDG
ncbi:MAG: hypothetical protein IID39_01105 [Planctomycetes bacterium]|nr:hypothetical protein [Planctomycetota bacterium]